MIVLFNSHNNLPLTKNSFIADITSAPTIFQLALKKADVYPSGPGAFDSPILNMAFFISSSQTELTILRVRCAGIILANKLLGSWMSWVGLDSPRKTL